MTDAAVTSAAPPEVRLLAGLSEIAGGYDVILSDVWGVVHNGMTAYAAAADALARFRAGGGAVVLISNAPRPGVSVLGQLDRLGVPRTAFDDVVTSGDIARKMVSDAIGSPFFHLGPERDRPIFEGLAPRFASPEEAEWVLCSGLWDDHADAVEDYRPLLERMLARDLLMACANPDIVVEVGDRLVPCAGAIAQLYESMGGRTVYTGKPHRPVYEEALARAERVRGAPAAPGRLLAIGDAIRTDVAGARAIGADALFVARGIHAEALGLARGPLDPALARAWFAEQTHRPDAAIELLVW